MKEEEKDKFLLQLEWLILFLGACVLCIMILLIDTTIVPENYKVPLIVLCSVVFAITLANAIKIEQVAGYYECGKCHHKYVPTYNSVFWAMHYGRTRYLRCPKCNEKSWNKKVLKK